MLKGFDADKINTHHLSAVIELLQGQGGPLANVLCRHRCLAALGARPADRRGNNLNAVLATVDAERALRPVDQLQQLVKAAWLRTGIRSRAFAAGVDDDGSYGTVAESALPLQGILENARRWLPS